MGRAKLNAANVVLLLVEYWRFFSALIMIDERKYVCIVSYVSARATFVLELYVLGALRRNSLGAERDGVRHTLMCTLDQFCPRPHSRRIDPPPPSPISGQIGSAPAVCLTNIELC